MRPNFMQKTNDIETERVFSNMTCLEKTKLVLSLVIVIALRKLTEPTWSLFCRKVEY